MIPRKWYVILGALIAIAVIGWLLVASAFIIFQRFAERGLDDIILGQHNLSYYELQNQTYHQKGTIE